MLVAKLPMQATDTTQFFPLAFADNGETVKLTEIHAGRKLRKRLSELGLAIGMTVRVVQANTAGPLILAVQNDTRLAIGRGMAQKILVKHIHGGE